VGSSGATRGEVSRQEVERQQQHSGGRGRCTASAAEEAEEHSVPEEEEERGSEGSLCNFQKFQGSFYKVKFPADPKP
jgi:hypothetical protein